MAVYSREVASTASQSFSTMAERAGVALVASVGLVSALSTLGLLLYIVWNASVAGERGSFVSRGLRSFTFSSLGCYLISLLICDLLQGVAFTLNYRWAVLGSISEGTMCTIQGAVSQVGELGTAIWSMAIAIHTFWLLFLVKQPHHFTVTLTMVLGWIIISCITIVGPKAIQRSHRGSFYGPTGAWCWIGSEYGLERVLCLYAWVFGALGLSCIIYTLIYLRFTNVITMGESGFVRFQTFRSEGSVRHAFPTTTRGLTLGFGPKQSTPAPYNAPGGLNDTLERDRTDSALQFNSRLKRTARRIMWYPLVYGVVVIPVAICRMGVLAGWEPPFGFLIFAGVCFGSSGFTNTILFITTRRSFITQQSKIQATRVHVTTQHVVVQECPDLNHSVDERDIEMKDHIMFSDPKGSPASPTPPMFLYNGAHPGMRGNVMIIE